MRRGAIAGFAAVAALVLLSGAQSGPTQYDRQQDARIAALEARLASPSPIVAPAPSTTLSPTATAAPSSKIVQVTTANTQGQFSALVADQTVDTIEFQSGVYRGWHVYIRQTRTKPLTVRPCAGCAVTFDDTGGTSGNGLFYLGANVGLPGYPTSPTTDIAFTGPFTIQNYRIGATGLIYTGWVDRIRFDGVTVRGSSGSGGTSHALYISSDDNHRSSQIVADGWDVATSPGLTGVQTYHAPSVDGLTVKGWTIDGCYRAALLWSNPTAVDFDGWTIRNCIGTVDAQEQAQGVVRNSTASGSGPLAPGQGYWKTPTLVDGGGNSAQ